MTLFRRTENHKAGKTALGILVPPGMRTVVILRPRSLPCDLLAVKMPTDASEKLTFFDFDRDEAARLARQLHKDLEALADSETHQPEITANLWGDGYFLSVSRADMTWLACQRRPGQAYVPLVIPDREQAKELAKQLHGYVAPDAETGQEVYFNTQHFHG